MFSVLRSCLSTSRSSCTTSHGFMLRKSHSGYWVEGQAWIGDHRGGGGCSIAGGWWNVHYEHDALLTRGFGKLMMALIVLMLSLVETASLTATGAQPALGMTRWFNSHSAQSTVSTGTLPCSAGGWVWLTLHISHTQTVTKDHRKLGGHLFWKPIPQGRQKAKSPRRASLFTNLAISFAIKYDCGARLRNAVCSAQEKTATSHLCLGTGTMKDSELWGAVISQPCSRFEQCSVILFLRKTSIPSAQ